MLERSATEEIQPLSDEWFERSEFWADTTRENQPKRRKRQRRSHPVILCGHGISLRIDKGALVVRNGFTHYPQRQETHRFFPGDLDTPERIIVLDGSGSLSLAGLDWLQEQSISLVRIGWDGKATVAVGNSGSPTDAAKLEWQIKTASDSNQALAFSSDLIRRKLMASRELLLSLFSDSRAFVRADRTIEEALQTLEVGSVSEINDVLSIEGTCARAYFECWRGLELKWKGEGRNPVPPMWRVYDQRSSILTGKKPENYRAAHPLNAMLNYAYAVLEADTRIKVISEGYDPRIGILHVGNKRGKDSSFVFDMMEPERPIVERVVLDLALGETFSAKDFVLRKDGVCRLSPQLAGALAASVSPNLQLGYKYQRRRHL